MDNQLEFSFGAAEGKEEVWKDVLSKHVPYQISSLGSIRRLPVYVKRLRDGVDCLYKPKTLKQQVTHKGYHMVILRLSKDKQQGLAIHRLVAKAFIPNPENKPEVNHKNGIKTDNRVENLEWVTKSENEKHAHRYGLKNNKGQNHPSHKLDDIDVLMIRKLISEGKRAIDVGRMYSVSESIISEIKNNKKWTHLK